MSKDDLDDPSAGIIAQDMGSLDLGYGAVPPNYNNISSGYGTDTITMSTSTMTGSITLPTTITTTGTTGYTIGSANSTVYTTGAGSYNWNNPPTVNITGTGIDMAAGTDISIDGKSLKEFMNKMEERLAILIPNPKKLEQFEALKKAYEHYKLMEQLCQEETKEED